MPFVDIPGGRAAVIEAVATPGAAAGRTAGLAAAAADGPVPRETLVLAEVARVGCQTRHRLIQGRDGRDDTRATAFILAGQAPGDVLAGAVPDPVLPADRGIWHGQRRELLLEEDAQDQNHGQGDDGEEASDPREPDEVSAFGAQLP